MSPWVGSKQLAAEAEQAAELQRQLQARAAELLAEHLAATAGDRARLRLAAATGEQQDIDEPDRGLPAAEGWHRGATATSPTGRRRQLTAQQRADVLTRLATTGTTQAQLARDLGVGPSAINNIVQRDRAKSKPPNPQHLPPGA